MDRYVWDQLLPDFSIPGLTETLSPIMSTMPPDHSRVLVSDGDQGTAQTIAIMQKMVNQWKRDDTIRNLVGNILNGGSLPPDCPCSLSPACQPKDYYCYAKTLYEWVRDNILYTYDPNLVEYIESPLRVLKNRIGDCDSQDMLLTSMFEQLGLPAQFVTIKADAERPNDYSHVYTRVKIPNVGWVVADPTMPKSFGWEPEGDWPKRYWPASSDELSMPVDDTPSVSGGMFGMRGLRGLGIWPFSDSSSGASGLDNTQALIVVLLTIGGIWASWKMVQAISAANDERKRLRRKAGDSLVKALPSMIPATLAAL